MHLFSCAFVFSILYYSIKIIIITSNRFRFMSFTTQDMNLIKISLHTNAYRDWDFTFRLGLPFFTWSNYTHVIIISFRNLVQYLLVTEVLLLDLVNLGVEGLLSLKESTEIRKTFLNHFSFDPFQLKYLHATYKYNYIGCAGTVSCMHINHKIKINSTMHN